MGVTVAAAINTATTAIVRPRLSYVVSSPTTTASVSIPVASVAYVDLVVGAALDTTGRFKFIADVSVVLDTTSIATSKLLGDAFGFQDDTSVSFAKPSFDVLVTSDELATAVSKALADTYGFSDEIITDVTKRAFDAFGFTDADTFNLAKLVTDGVGMNDLFDATDGSLYSFVKNVANVVFATEQLSRDVAKTLGDSVAALSTPALHVTKAPFVDATGAVSDFSVLSSQLSKSDSVTPTTTVAFDITKLLVDVFTYAEFFAVAVQKPVYDTVAATDTPVLGIDKPQANIVYVDEQSVYSLTKSLSDAVSFSDVLIATRVFQREFSDSVSTSDYNIWVVTKGLSNTVSTDESVSRVYTKLLNDGFALNDLADVGDGITFLLTQTVANVAFITDNWYKQTAKGATDTISVPDSGSLVSQGYCDLTYFAEDYVGSTRSF